MASTYDFAIFGGNALSSLVAGLLAHDHNKQVLLIADPVSPQRLPRGLDVALLLASRPQSWKMLRRGTLELQDVMASLDAPNALEPAEVQISPDRPETQAALAHIAATARGYGQVSRNGRFSVPRFASPVTTAGSRVVTIERDAAKLEFTRGGLARLLVSGEASDVGQIVIADDAALLELMPQDERPLALRALSVTATLTTAAKRLPAALMVYPDRGVTLQQRADHTILALVNGDSDVETRLASTLPGPFPLQRLATTHFRRVATNDGAPMIGRVKPSKLVMLSGLGDAGAFFAPILARSLAGVPADDEKPWIASLSPTRPREAIADFVGAA